MPELSFHTNGGTGELSFNSLGISSVELPQATRLPAIEYVEDLPGADNARHAVELLTRYFKGESVCFDDVKIDLSGHSPFFRKICQYVRGIPAGKFMSYGEVASSVGKSGSARAVGRVMARNPVPIIVPCHRVVAADGRLTGYSAAGGLNTKAALLKMEGVVLKDDGRAVL